MNSKQRRDAFLASAQDAENHADQSLDRYERESWLRIAESYRELARRQGVTEH